MSFELHLFRPKPEVPLARAVRLQIGAEDLLPVDQAQVGEFLLGLGKAIRFGARTELGEQ